MDKFNNKYKVFIYQILFLYLLFHAVHFSTSIESTATLPKGLSSHLLLTQQHQELHSATAVFLSPSLSLVH